MSKPSLHFAAGWYLWKGSYANRHIPADAGFDYHAPTKLWRTRVPFIAAKLARYADAECKVQLASHARELAEYEIEAQKEIAAKGVRK